MKKEYIEREALLKKLNDEKTQYNADINFIIKNMPAADVVHVVRCEDCRYYGNTKKHKRCGECTNYNRIAYPDEFCSYGERRKDK